MSASASRSNTCWYFRISSSIWRFLYFFFTASPTMSSSSAAASRIRLALFPRKALFFFFLVQPQHHCTLNPVISICLDSDTAADTKYIAQVDTLTVLPFSYHVNEKKTLFNSLFKQLFPFSWFCNAPSFYLFFRVPRTFRYLGHRPPLHSCLLASWVLCVTVCVSRPH